MAELVHPIEPYLPRVLPAEWQIEAREAEGIVVRSRAKGLLVIFSTWEPRSDGRRWLHLSVSRRSQLPSWEDLRYVKDTFLGPSRAAYQILPSESEYYSLHPYCLHLWSCLDGDPIPDLRNDVPGFGKVI